MLRIARSTLADWRQILVSPTPLDASASRRSRWLVALLVAALAGLVYANALANGFALDDVIIVQHNMLLRDWQGLTEVWTSRYWPNLSNATALYRPITIASYILDWKTGHGSATLFHATNIALHAVACLLGMQLACRLGASARGALVGGIVFCVHPVHVEAVANVVGRAEILMTVFVLSGILLHLAHGVSRHARLFGVPLCFLLALLTKEGAIAMPALLVLVDLYDPRRRETVWRSIMSEAPLYLLLLGTLVFYVGLRYAVLGALGGSTIAPGLIGLPTSARVATAVRLFLEMVRLTFYPRDLVAEYGAAVLMPVTWSSPLAWAGLLVGLGLLSSALVLVRRAHWWSLAVFWFMLSIFIVSNLAIPVGILISERSFYLPSIGYLLGIAGAVTWAVPHLSRRTQHAALALTAFWCVAAAGRTWHRTPSWASTEMLMRTLSLEHPESFRALEYLGKSALANNQPGMALDYLTRAFALAPDPAIHTSIGNAWLRMSRPDSAISLLLPDCDAGYAPACLVAARASRMAHRLPEARNIIDRLIARGPITPALILEAKEIYREQRDTTAIKSITMKETTKGMTTVR